MAKPKTTATIVAMFLAITFSSFYATWAQAPAPNGLALSPSEGSGTGLAPGPSGTDCTTQILGMADCLSYVQTGSNLTQPDKPCCPELKSLVENYPQCLCKLLANGNSSDFNIDVKRATKLPSVCKVDTPPPSACALLGIPVGGPSPSQSPTSSSGPSPGGLPSSGSSTALPPAKNNGNKASRTTATSVVAVLVGFAITFSSTIFF